MEKLDLSNLNLGPLDADKDSNLLEYFIPFGDFTKINKKEKFIVVGAKGTGKSAIKKYFESSREKKNLLVKCLDKSYGFSIEQLNVSSTSEIHTKMLGYITSIAIDTILTTDLIDKDAKKILQGFQDEIPLIKKILTPLKIKPPFFEYAVSDLLDPKKRSHINKITSKPLITAINNSIKGKDLWIIIDDVDKVFSSNDAKINTSFIGGLIAACSEINTVLFNKKIFILVLLRSEIYEELDRREEEFDKEEENVWELVWDIKELERFLARRIKWALKNKDDEQDWKYWSMLFDTSSKSDTEKLQSYLLSKTINGPRDILLLTNYAKELAVEKKSPKISLENIVEVEYKYGVKKLHQIVANFKDIYADVDLIIEKIFRNQKRDYSRKSLEAIINTQLLENRNSLKAFEHIDWIHTCTAYRVIAIFYRIGFLGFWDDIKKRFIFSMEYSNADKKIIESDSFAIHPAFEKYLELK